jgi:hypothetical protein
MKIKPTGENEMKTNRLDEILNALEANRQSFARRVEELRRDTHYSEYGRADLIASAWDEARLKHETLKDELNEYIDSERARLERFAFNAPKGEEQNYRDAIARASAITDPNERMKAIGLAVKTNDTVALRALAAVSHGLKEGEHSWSTVIEASKHDRDIAQLVAFESEHGALRSPEQKFTGRMALRAPQKPAEVSQANMAGARDASR